MNKTFIIALIPILLTQIVDGAETIYQYGGTIGTDSSNGGGILGLISAGDPISGYFTFDPNNLVSGDRYQAVIAISIGSSVIEIDSDLNYIRAQDNISVSGLGIVDRFRHGFDSNGPISALSPLYVYSLYVEFIDTTGSVFDGVTPLPVDLNFSDYDIARWGLKGTDIATRTQNFQVSGTITSISVPEADAFLLSGFAVIGMMSIRRRSKSE